MTRAGGTRASALPITLLLVAGCASTPAPPPPSGAAGSAPVTATDPRVSELRILVHELVDQMEVLQSRMNRMEDVLVQLSDGLSSERATVSSESVADDVAAVRRYESASDAADLYRAALLMFGRGQNDQARSTFETVYRTDPAGELADNALFWIAETHFVMKEFGQAIRHYDRVVKEFPSQNKAADALHRKSLALVKLGDLSLAKRTLEILIERYPYSTAASAAKQELERIRY